MDEAQYWNELKTQIHAHEETHADSPKSMAFCAYLRGYIDARTDAMAEVGWRAASIGIPGDDKPGGQP